MNLGADGEGSIYISCFDLGVFAVPVPCFSISERTIWSSSFHSSSCVGMGIFLYLNHVHRILQ